MGIQYQGSAGAVFGPAGANHSQGMVPDPGSTADAAGANRFLRSDATFHQVDYASVTGTPAALVPGQLPGTSTNDNAAAGDVGEYVTSINVTGVALGNGTVVNITSITLSAGDWDISGYAGFTAAAATTIPFFEANICTTSASFGSPVEAGTATVLETVSGFGANSVNDVALPVARGSFAVSTTVFLNVEVTFSAGSANGQGRLRARRMR